jgi:Holliday junction resolvase RusA-like endonuclease
MSSRPIAVTPLRLWLPPGPSVNEMFRNAGYGHDSKTQGRIATNEYRLWQAEAGQEVLRQRVKRLEGPVVIDLFHGERSVLADCSNYIKAVEDLLVHLGIIPGDNAKSVRRISSGWVPDFYGTIVHVTPIQQYQHGGARWWVGFDEGVLGLEKPTVPSGRRKGQKGGEGTSQTTRWRRSKKAAAEKNA